MNPGQVFDFSLSGNFTIALIVFPFLAGLLMIPAPENRARHIAFIITLIQAIITCYVIYGFDVYQQNGLLGSTQAIADYPWIGSLGVHFFVGIDGISLLMIILTNFLLPLIILSSWNRKFKTPRLFYLLILTMQSALIGVFTSLDAFLYYIFWELALIPIYFIILLWGGENRVRITFRFFIYTLLGSLFMLIGIIWLYLQTSGRSFSIVEFYNLSLDESSQRWIFWAFFIAYAIKIPLLPFHSWQPETYYSAPGSGTMLLSGIMLKMGIFSIIRWTLPIVPDAMEAYSEVAIIMGLAGVIYGSWMAIGQNDLKRLFAWSSLAHVGLITAGIFTLRETGIQGAVFQMVAHGVNAVGLFFVADIISSRMNTTETEKLGGIRKLAPVFATVYLILSFASAALPLTGPFIGEFLLLISLYESSFWFAGIAGLTVIFGAVYMLRAYKVSMLGEPAEKTVFKDLIFSEKITFFILIGFIFLLGIFPQLIFNVSEESVRFLLKQIKVIPS